MDLKLFRDLLNIDFKIFSEKASCDREKPQLLATAQIASKEVDGYRSTPPGAHYKRGKAGHWVTNCPSPPPGPCPNWTSKTLGELIASLFLDKVKPGTQISPPQESLSDLLGLMLPGTSVITEEPRMVVQVAGKSLPFLIDSGPAWSLFPVCSGKNHAS